MEIPKKYIRKYPDDGCIEINIKYVTYLEQSIMQAMDKIIVQSPGEAYDILKPIKDTLKQS